jgi:hypothetical protein
LNRTISANEKPRELAAFSKSDCSFASKPLLNADFEFESLPVQFVKTVIFSAETQRLSEPFRKPWNFLPKRLYAINIRLDKK